MMILTSKATQNARLRAHLLERGSISPVEANAVHGITRLAARIYDLRAQGMTIDAAPRKDEAGHRYTRYSLSR